MSDGKETQRALAVARERYPESTVEKVEHWDAYVPRRGGGRGKRRDMFGWADIIVAGPDAGFILIQVTTRQSMGARRSKILGKRQAGDGDPAAQAERRLRNFLNWTNAGGRVFVWGWNQPNGPGTRWKLTEWEVTQADAKQQHSLRTSR